MIVVCDLDGTVADNSHRVGFIQSSKKDWDSFYNPDLIARDPPIEAACRTLRRMSVTPGVHLYFLTGRPERTRMSTLRWMHTHVADDLRTPIYMRPDGDYTKADVFKARVLNEIQAAHNGRALLLIDDDLRNQEMYMQFGIFLKAPECWEVFR